MRWRWLFLLLWPSLVLAQAPVLEHQQTVSVTQTNTTVTFSGPMDDLCLINDGANPVVYDWDGTAVFSATTRAAINPGETRCFSRKDKPNKFRQVGLICNTGLTATVRITALP